VLIGIGLYVVPSLLVVALAGLLTTGLANLAIGVAARNAGMDGVLGGREEPDVEAAVVPGFRSYALWAFAGVIAVRLAYSADSLIIGRFLDPVSITLYFAPWKLVEFVRMIGHGATPFFLPFGSQRWAVGDFEAVSTALYQGIRIVIILTFPLWVFLLGYGKDLLCLWMGPALRGSYPILVLLVMPQAVILCFSAGSSLLYGLGLHKYLVVVSLISGAMNVALSVLWVRSLGVAGVALATMVMLLLSFLFNATMYPIWLKASRAVVLRIIGRGVGVLGALFVFAASGNSVLHSALARLVLSASLAVGFIPLFLVWEFSREEILGLRRLVLDALQRRNEA
jgi:O-antigen/teichoic acid export membrane protein